MRQYFLVFAIILAIYTLWLFNIAMENGPFIDDFPIKTSIYKGFSMAMLNNQMVVTIEKPLATSRQEFRPKWAMASVALLNYQRATCFENHPTLRSQEDAVTITEKAEFGWNNEEQLRSAH